MTDTDQELIDELLAGRHRALARVITKIENRQPGYRDLVSALYEHTGGARIIGVTGSPGTGKSTLVDKLAKTYRDRDLTVGVIAIDPASPFTGGAVLGDRIRMASTAGDMDVFFRSMSARGSLGGLSAATADAVRALDAFGKDRIIVETVGAGQNEIDVVRTADTVAVLVTPESGDAVQMLKAGILEIGDVFVVNKADLSGADRIVSELKDMIGVDGDRIGSVQALRDRADASGAADASWEPRIVETIAETGEGIDELVAAFADHYAFLESSGLLELKARMRSAEEIRRLLREDIGELLEEEIDANGGIDVLVDAVMAGETDPYRIADTIVAPIEACLDEERQRAAEREL